jgi:ubiquinone/menaquinone biosynthesis C-methylase UbiE
MLPDASLNTCCAVSYGHPLARWLLGESFHPGGLKLTTHLARIMGVESGSILLDAGSGRGTSAVHLAKTFGCRVTGITLEEEGVAAGYRLARQNMVEDMVGFLQGDIQETDLEAESFNAVLMECVLSIIPGKEATLRRLYDALRPGAYIGLTDVIVQGLLPPHLQSILAVAACTGDARSLEGYSHLVQSAGFEVDQSQDLPEIAASFLRDIKGKLLVAEVAIGLGKLPIDRDALAQVKQTLAEVQDLVSQGVLSYGLVVAHKPT